MLSRSILWKRLNRLFTVIMVFDRELNIIRCSDTLERYVPRAADSPPLLDVFEIARPAAVNGDGERCTFPPNVSIMIRR